MTRPMRVMAVLLAIGCVSQPVAAFQESTPEAPAAAPPAAAPAPAPVEAPKMAPTPGKGVNLKMPEMSIGEGTGTEVRIPGFGKVGVLPKLDFGLELLYGATESRSVRPDDRSEPSDVQIRGTIKHRF